MLKEKAVLAPKEQLTSEQLTYLHGLIAKLEQNPDFEVPNTTLETLKNSLDLTEFQYDDLLDKVSFAKANQTPNRLLSYALADLLKDFFSLQLPEQPSKATQTQQTIKTNLQNTLAPTFQVPKPPNSEVVSKVPFCDSPNFFPKTKSNYALDGKALDEAFTNFYAELSNPPFNIPATPDLLARVISFLRLRHNEKGYLSPSDFTALKASLQNPNYHASNEPFPMAV